jgi:hypothetical protein
LACHYCCWGVDSCLNFLKAVKSKLILENWKLKFGNFISLLILFIFLILLIQLSLKFLEVTFLDIAGEGAVVVLLKIIWILAPRGTSLFTI